MRRSLGFAPICAVLLLCEFPSAWANEDMQFIPSVYLSRRDFQYRAGSGKVDSQLYSLGGGLTVTAGRFYAGLSGESNITSDDEAANNLFAERLQFDREDAAISLGYSVNESISVFTGYKYGKTILSIPGTLSRTEQSATLQGNGLFVGAGGGWEVKDWGVFSFSAAYANMDAKYADPINLQSDGIASGTSLSIAWKGPITKEMYYDLALIRHHYYYEEFNHFDNPITETIISLQAGLSYRF